MFLEVEFPRTISFKGTGGPGFSTEVKQGFSGAEQRNRNWAFPRGEWTVSLITPAGVVKQDFVDQLRTFFLVVGGKADAFRLKDGVAYKATAQPLVVNPDGDVQLAITHSIAGRSFVQFISKPITADVLDYQGNPLTDTVFLSGSDTPLTVDHTTGIAAAGAGTLVDFEYHFPVRFDVDKLALQVEPSPKGDRVVSWSSIPLIEVAPPEF